MRNSLAKLAVIPVLFAALVFGMWRYTSAGTTEFCAYAGGDHGGGCNGCWVVATGTEEALFWTVQAKCLNNTGDSVCFDTWWSAIPSPGCYRETISCGNQVRLYLVQGTETSGSGACSGQFIGTTLSEANDAVDNRFGAGRFNNWVLIADWRIWESCLKEYSPTSDVMTGANCTAP